MEGNDFLDGASTGGPAPTTAANPLPNMMSLRPNTAAAVATGGIGLDNDNMGMYMPSIVFVPMHQNSFVLITDVVYILL